jgi:hypothetical protein
MLLNVITYLALRRSMSKKHYEKIMSRRTKRIEKATKSIEEIALLDQKLPLYMDSNGNIDWTKLAKHIREATSGR